MECNMSSRQSYLILQGPPPNVKWWERPILALLHLFLPVLDAFALGCLPSTWKLHLFTRFNGGSLRPVVLEKQHHIEVDVLEVGGEGM